MRQIYGLVRRLWHSSTCRFLVGCTFAAFVGVAASRTFLGSVAVVEGKSMYPNYPPGTHLYTTAISGSVDRGNVVLLDDGHEDYAVKRVIGLPGETVQIWRGSVFPFEKERRGATFVLGDDQYFVMGDNRVTSLDSRAYGPVQRRQIKRRVPTPDGFVAAYSGNYTLPDYGKTIMRSTDSTAHAISPF